MIGMSQVRGALSALLIRPNQVLQTLLGAPFGSTTLLSA
jgi:hypothetical protein